MKSICLIGFMGSGKTTIGRRIAEELKVSLIDTDEEIVRWKQASIPTIFEQEGEHSFRQYEKQILQSMPKENAVIATGGGIVEDAENRKALKENFYVVHLNPTFDVINSRLLHDSTRPLWKQKSEDKRNLYDKRMDHYLDCADISISIQNESIEETIRKIISSIKRG